MQKLWTYRSPKVRFWPIAADAKGRYRPKAVGKPNQGNRARLRITPLMFNRVVHGMPIGPVRRFIVWSRPPKLSMI